MITRTQVASLLRALDLSCRQMKAHFRAISITVLMGIAFVAATYTCMPYQLDETAVWVVASGEAELVVGACDDSLFKYCCKSGIRRSCTESSSWSCSDATLLSCLAGETKEGYCETATCVEIQNAFKTFNCNRETFPIKVDKCTATGLTTNVGCPEGQARCVYEHMMADHADAPTNDQCICGSGSYCAAALQPEGACTE